MRTVILWTLLFVLCTGSQQAPWSLEGRFVLILNQAPQQVVLWTCQRHDCATACDVASAPGGEARFAVCDCP
jgi:hypothetical protein